MMPCPIQLTESSLEEYIVTFSIKTRRVVLLDKYDFALSLIWIIEMYAYLVRICYQGVTSRLIGDWSDRNPSHLILASPAGVMLPFIWASHKSSWVAANPPPRFWTLCNWKTYDVPLKAMPCLSLSVFCSLYLFNCFCIYIYVWVFMFQWYTIMSPFLEYLS